MRAGVYACFTTVCVRIEILEWRPLWARKHTHLFSSFEILFFGLTTTNLANIFRCSNHTEIYSIDNFLLNLMELQKSHTNWILLPNEYYLLCSQLFRFSCDEWTCRSGILFLFMKLLTVSISLAFWKMKPRSPFIQIIKELNWTHSVLTQFDRTNCKMCIHIELAQVDFKPFQLECW